MRSSVGQSHSDVGVYLVKWCSQKWDLSVYCLKGHVTIEQQLQVRDYDGLHIQKYRRHTAASLAFPSYIMNCCMSYICWNIVGDTLGPAYSSLVFFSLSQENIEDIKQRAPPLTKINNWPFWHSRKKAEICSDALYLKSRLNNHLCMGECARDFAVSADECRIYILKAPRIFTFKTLFHNSWWTSHSTLPFSVHVVQCGTRIMFYICVILYTYTERSG